MLIQEANPDFIIENVDCPVMEVSKSCSFCSQSFTSDKDLILHTAAAHKDLLDSVSRNQAPVNETRHMNNMRKMICQCSLCHTQFSRLTDLTKHCVQQHGVGRMESGRHFYCNHCPGSQFLDLSHLAVHQRRDHHNIEDKSVNCPDCGKSFKKWTILKQHVPHHSHTKPFQCTACLKTFNWEASLRTHQKNCKYIGDIQMNKTDHPATKPQSLGFLNSSSIKVDSDVKPILPMLTPPRSNSQPVVRGQRVDDKKTGSKRFKCRLCSFVCHDRETMVDHVTRCPAVKMRMEMDHSRLQSQSSPSVDDSSQGLTQVSPTADDRTRDKRYHLDSQQSSTTLMRENTSHKMQDLVANSGKFGKLGFDCSICEQEFDDLESLDTHMILHTSTRSGRSIKNKKFFEDVAKDPVIKRQRRRIADVDAGRRKCAKVSTKCQDCGLVLDNHQDLFRHFLSHLDPNIVKTLPVYESGDTGN